MGIMAGIAGSAFSNHMSLVFPEGIDAAEQVGTVVTTIAKSIRGSGLCRTILGIGAVSFQVL